MTKTTNSKRMTLLSNEAIQILKNHSSELKISEGRKYESRLRLFTESKDSLEIERESAWTEYKQYLQSILSESKYDKIMKYYQFPLPIVDITESCLSDLYKVFDSRNRYFNVDINSATDKQVIGEKLKQLEYEKWIEDKGKEVLKNKPNSIIVIDKDDEGNPYPLMICSSRLYEYKVDKDSKYNGQLEYVAFVHSIEHHNDKETVTNYSFYDDKYYRVFSTDDHENFNLITEVAHNAGICPAIFFMGDELNDSNDYKRKIPFSNSLTKMNQWQVFDVYKTYSDHYAPFPIIEAPKDKCSVPNCHDGVLIEVVPTLINGNTVDRNLYKDCPSCKSRDLIGPGTVVRIEPKMDKDDPTEAGVFKIMDSPVESLKYIDEKLDKLEKNIRINTVGIDDIITDQAINEEQVESTYESRMNVLLKLKSNFDRVYKWMNIVTAKVMNPSVEISVSANFGTEFYLLDEVDLQNNFEKAKKIGLPESELDMIYRQLVDTKYKGNPSKISRAMIMKYIDPLPYMNKLEAKTAFDLGVITSDEYSFKIRLIKLVDRFEMENAPLDAFGIELKPYERVKKIKEILNTYNDEYIETKQAIRSEEAG